MELVRDIWTKQDGKEFNEYLITCGQPDRVAWTKNILNTQMNVLAVPSPKVREIVKIIARGNFISFLELNLWDYYENTAINGLLIDKIKDFEQYSKFLYRHASQADNWATCDVVPFKPKQDKKPKLLELAKKFIADDKTFVRRVGTDMLFSLTADSEFNDDVYKLICVLKGDTEYYVNMCVAWLVAEYFTKQREFGLKIFTDGILNKFTVNKAVQKCRDSFRISDDDKEMLLKFKVKA